MPPHRPHITATVLAVILLLALAVPAHAQPQERSGDPRGRYIVTLVDDADPEEVSRDQERAGGVARGHVYRRVLNGFAMEATEAALRRFERDPRVARVEVDGVVSTTGSTTQTSPPSWGLDRIDQRDRPVDGAYRYSRDGAGVDIYVLDTGISAHQDFGSRLQPGRNFTGGSPNDTADCNGHGTHVAGTAAGALHGVAKQAALVPVRVLGCNGRGFVSHVIAGLDWVAGRAGRRVANLSLEIVLDEDDEDLVAAAAAMDDAVAGAFDLGVTVVAAAGNANVDACGVSPARAPKSLTVGATGQWAQGSFNHDRRADYSNFGTCLDLFAPGSRITSTWYTSDSAVNMISGTSMAAPHVAGAAALHLSASPGATPGDVSTAIIGSATTGAVTHLGTGSPNRLLRAVATPRTPLEVTATAGPGEVTISWTPPADDGGRPLTGYTISSPELISPIQASATDTSTTVTELENGTTYSFRVAAGNEVGTGDLSAAVSATPVTAPEAPAAVLADAGDESATVHWAPPRSDGGSPITSYLVAVTPGGATLAVDADDRSAVVEDLENGTPHTFTVTAVNAEGPAEAGATTAPVTPAPDGVGTGRPTGVAATADLEAETVTVTWDPPVGGTEAVTGYRVVRWVDGVVAGHDEAGPEEHAAEIEGLTGGVDYTFRVQALPVVGPTLSVDSEGDGVVIYTAPTPPRSVTAKALDRAAQLSWLAPTDDGGAAITGYTVTAKPGGQKATTTGATSATVTGLTNGTAYTFTVTATNAAGKVSDPSAASAAVTPHTVPEAPRNVKAVPGDARAAVSWDAPSSDGGAKITKYTVTASPGGRTATTDGARSVTVTGLANGTSYTFTVTATNTAGTGPKSVASSAVTPRTVPGVPRNVLGSAGDASAAVRWDPPSSDGGAAIVGYTVTASPGGQKATTTGATSVSVTGLTNGTSYTFTVTATNVVGTGPASSPSGAVTPLRPLPPALDGDPATTTRLTDGAPSALAVSISQRRFADADGTSEGPRARHVVLSRDDAFPDSLAGASLTADGPLLYTGSDALPSATAAEIRRILPGGGTVYLLGGEAAITAGVAAQVAALRSPGYRVVRLAGDSRIETALKVADEVRRLRPGSEVLVARAGSPADNPTAAWADSVTGGAYGAIAGTPVILTPSTLGSSGELHSAVAEWLRRDAPTRSVVLGGTAAVSDAVALRFPGVVRVSGGERAETAKEVAVRLWGAKPSGTRRHIVINGFDSLGWAHGLAAAGLAADHRAPLLLVNRDVVPVATAAMMSSCGAPQVDTLLVGPRTAITDPVAQELERIDGAAC